MRQKLHARHSPGRVVRHLVPVLAIGALVAGCQGPDRMLAPPVDGPQLSTSPADGKGKIAFHSSRDGDFDVVVMNADGSEQTKLTSDANNDIDPVWSPNGKRIAFNRFPADWSSCEVFVMNSDGTGVTQLTHGGGYEFGGIWSPNGKHIAFVANHDGSNDIYVINADGSGLKRVTTGADVGTVTAWSPNGKQMMFSSSRDGGDGDIFVMNADGTNITDLTNNDVDDEGDRASWSPDGKLIAFSSRRDGGDLDIFVMNADGTGVRQITGIGGDWVDDDDPTWSPNGKHLAFQSSRDGDEEVWTSTLDASEVTQLTFNVGAFDAVPSWVSGSIHDGPGVDNGAYHGGALTRATVHPNSQRYRDLGSHPTTGRSGSASLTTRALLGRDGVTTLDISTGVLDGASVGIIAKTQVKAFDAGDKLTWTMNYTQALTSGAVSYQYPGRARNTVLQAQSNVRGIDGARTDVITVSTPVKLRPDLRANDSLGAPATAIVNTPVNIFAAVRETNGDVGARVNCVLYVNGARADEASGIWVDAGSSASCAFAWTFTSVGTQQVQVKLEHITPADYDNRNDDSPTASIEITQPLLYYSAWLYEVTSNRLDEFSNSWVSSDGLRREESSYYNTASEHYQSAGVYASGSVGVSFPLRRVQLSQSTGGSLIAETDASDVAPTYQWGDATNGAACLYTGSDGVFFSLCTGSYSDGGPVQRYTSTQYGRTAGEVTYFGRNFYHIWNDTPPAYEFVWVYNYDDFYPSPVPFVAYGNDYSFQINVQGSDQGFAIAPVVQLTPFDYSYDTGRSCWDYTWEGTGHSCSHSAYSSAGWRGSAYGSTELVP